MVIAPPGRRGEYDLSEVRCITKPGTLHGYQAGQAEKNLGNAFLHAMRRL